jgi:hypothetical protein
MRHGDQHPDGEIEAPAIGGSCRWRARKRGFLLALPICGDDRRRGYGE